MQLYNLISLSDLVSNYLINRKLSMIERGELHSRHSVCVRERERELLVITWLITRLPFNSSVLFIF